MHVYAASSSLFLLGTFIYTYALVYLPIAFELTAI